MGKIDIEAKNYLSHNDRFADIFNFYLYGGERRIKPDDLKPLDSGLITVPYGNNAREPKQRYRDIFRSWSIMQDDETVYAVALGGEPQAKVNYAMPVKNGLYDFFFYADQVVKADKSYKNQYDEKEKENAKEKADGKIEGTSEEKNDVNVDTDVKSNDAKAKGRFKIKQAEYMSGFRKEDRLIPVITLTIYLGADEWDGPLTLKEMLHTKDPRILELVGNYKVHLIAPFLLSDEDLRKFSSDFRELMEYIKYSTDWRKLDEVTQDGERFRHLKPDVANLMNIVTNSKLDFEYDEEEGTVDMCKAIEDMKEHYLEEEKKKRVELENEMAEEKKKNLEHVKSVMRKLSYTAQEALDFLDVPNSEWEKYLSAL